MDKAQARFKPADDEGHVVPVLCMQLQLENVAKTRLLIEQPFLHCQHEQVKAAAHKHKVGERLTVELPLHELQMICHSALHIHVHKPLE